MLGAKSTKMGGSRTEWKWADYRP